MLDMNEANRLREIAGHLTQLELLNKNKADAAKDKRRKALRPLFENWGLIANTELAYPLHRGCAELFIMLKNRASEWQELDLGNCTELDLRFGKRQTGGAKHPSFIDELNRLADELEKEPAETGQDSTRAKEPSKEQDKAEAGTQGYPGPRRQVPTSDADRQRAYLDGYTVGDYKYAPDLPKRHSHKTYPVQSVATKGGQQQTETGRNTTPAKRGMFKRITVWIFEKTWRLIGAIIVAIIGSFIAAILIRYFW